MKEQDFLNGISNIENDIIEQFVVMDNRLNSKVKLKRLCKHIAATAACFILIISGFVVIPMLGNKGEFQLPTHIDNIIWDDRTESITDQGGNTYLWNGWNLDSSFLYEKLDKADPDQYFALNVTKRFIDGYVYKGKKVSEIVAEKDEKYMLAEKLGVLIKEGDALKYGDLLYTQGTPDGEKWAEAYYYERIRYYGEDFLAEYISGGEFDKVKAENHCSKANKEAEQLTILYDEAYKAYNSESVKETKEVFLNMGFSAIVKNNKMFVFIKKEELANLRVEDKASYTLTLAKRRNYEHVEGNIPTFENNVSGFALEKIDCFVPNQYSGVPKSDEELINRINLLIKTGQFDTDRIVIRVTSSKKMTEDMFSHINYESVNIGKKYPNGTRVSMYVKYENINLEALKDLSNMQDVEHIDICLDGYFEVTEF